MQNVTGPEPTINRALVLTLRAAMVTERLRLEPKDAQDEGASDNGQCRTRGHGRNQP